MNFACELSCSARRRGHLQSTSPNEVAKKYEVPDPIGRALAALLLFWLVAPGPTVAGTTALQVTPAGGPPQSVRGSDGREHIAYNLVITNAFTADATLKSMVVRGGGERLLTLRGEDLAFYTRPLGSEEPTTAFRRPRRWSELDVGCLAPPGEPSEVSAPPDLLQDPRRRTRSPDHRQHDDRPARPAGRPAPDRDRSSASRRRLDERERLLRPRFESRSTMLAENGAYVSPETSRSITSSSSTGASTLATARATATGTASVPASTRSRRARSSGPPTGYRTSRPSPTFPTTRRSTTRFSSAATAW